MQPSFKKMLNRIISRILPYLPKKLIWLFSKHYIAGETLEDAIKAAEKFKTEGIDSTIDLLGEFITGLDEARANKNAYLSIIERVKDTDIDGYYSLKPTFFGLLIDKETAYRHIREIVARAAKYNHFVRIDMEDSACTDLEIELFRRLKPEFPETIGLVLQAYLKRTYQDIQNLKDLNAENAPLNIRLCKGIYIEPESIAYQSYEEINAHFLKDIELMLQEKMSPAIATHDVPVVQGAYRLLETYQVPKEQYEFQMLYGVTPSLRRSILEKGHRMRVYIPFGRHWFGYCTRRIKENPRLSAMVLKALFHKG